MWLRIFLVTKFFNCLFCLFCFYDCGFVFELLGDLQKKMLGEARYEEGQVTKPGVPAFHYKSISVCATFWTILSAFGMVVFVARDLYYYNYLKMGGQNQNQERKFYLNCPNNVYSDYPSGLDWMYCGMTLNPLVVFAVSIC